MDSKLSRRWLVCIIAVICCALWGSAFPFIKIGYRLFEIKTEDVAGQIVFAGVRFTLAGIMAVAFGSVASKKVLLPRKSSWGMIAKLALFQTYLQYIFFYIGLAHTTGVKASIIEGASAFIAILIASLIFHQEKLSFVKIAACILGFCGVGIANIDSNGLKSGLNISGDGLILISTVAYAVSSVLIKRYSQKENPVILSGFQFGLGGIAMIITGILMGGTIDVWSAKAVFCLWYLGFLSAAAYSLWGVLLKYNSVSSVTVYSFMIPVFGVVFSAVLAKESSQAFGLNIIVSLILVSIGIVLINKEKTIDKKVK